MGYGLRGGWGVGRNGLGLGKKWVRALGIMGWGNELGVWGNGLGC